MDKRAILDMIEATQVNLASAAELIAGARDEIPYEARVMLQTAAENAVKALGLLSE
jgi:hypothetical protein